ncbi:hypothetical protein, partial [Rhodocaloribacter sp.]
MAESTAKGPGGVSGMRIAYCVKDASTDDNGTLRGCLVSQSEGEHETFSRPKYADLEVRTGSTGRQTEPKGEGIG